MPRASTTSAPARTSRSRNWPRWSRGWSAFAARSIMTGPSPTAHRASDGLRTHPGIGLASGDLARARHRAGLRPCGSIRNRRCRGLRSRPRGRQTGLPMHAFLSRHVAGNASFWGWWSTARDRPPRWSPCPCCSGSWARWASGMIIALAGFGNAANLRGGHGHQAGVRTRARTGRRLRRGRGHGVDARALAVVSAIALAVAGGGPGLARRHLRRRGGHAAGHAGAGRLPDPAIRPAAIGLPEGTRGLPRHGAVRGFQPRRHHWPAPRRW